ncbi:universal stress protein [Haladaptatus caseinilyticus]|uniref:universal stress protein n=1 Tax=Haladaptatus caseinilyticus TaxID=2993314 RepID=UPI00224AAF46|nr:universal stress protein [Haladaptatus caseinilyticus]
MSTVTDIQIDVPHRTIIEYVDEHSIDLVVIGIHGRTRLRHTLLGSVAEQVVRTSSAPVLAVRADQQLLEN